MLSSMFPMYLINSYNNPEYYNLSEEEKNNMDFVDKCIYSDNKKISDASFKTMLLIIEISNNPDLYEPEDLHVRFDEINEGLSIDEQSIMSKFTLACINTMGIYSEEAVQERQLRKERNDK